MIEHWHNVMSEQQTRPFIPVRIAVLTVSDSRDETTDTSGQTLIDRIGKAGHLLAARLIIRDDLEVIESTLRRWTNDPEIEVIIATGGTGVTGRDVTPEAVCAVMDKEIPGFGELFRWISFQKIGTSTIQSRAIGAVANGRYIFAIPGSTGACKDAWDSILAQQLDLRHRPCNFVELLPRLRER